MKRIILISLAGGILFSVGLAQVLGFPDVTEDQWFYPYVMTIKDWNIVNGNDDGTFKPSNNINRAEFSKMIVRYDERVDQKIFDAVSVIATSEALRPKIPVGMPVIMHFDRDDVEIPSLCPVGWDEVNYARIYEGTETLNRRTCMTKKVCTSLVLRDRDKLPALCPAGWSEGDFGRGRKKERVRTCFLCEAIEA